MRIVILADPLDNQQAGIHYYTRQLVSYLAKVDHQAEYYILRRKKDHLFPEDRQIVVKNYKLPGYAALRMFYIIPAKISKLKADVVVEPAHFGPFNLPAKIKRVTVMHDLTPILFPKLHRYHSQLLQRIFLKGILKRASLIITNSLSTSKDLFNYYPEAKDKTRQIYLGRDEMITKTTERSALDHFTGGKPYFLYTGTLEPRKNLNLLLDAFADFKERSGSPHLLLITGGKGWKTKSFYKNLESNTHRNDIVLCGFVDREVLPALYSHAVAFVFPSEYEGFGFPVLEAMSCGTACIVSNSSSLPEVGGDAVLYFNPGNTNELSDAMLGITNDDALRKDLSEKALKQSQKFSWDNYVTEFDKEIKKLL